MANSRLVVAIVAIVAIVTMVSPFAVVLSAPAASSPVSGRTRVAPFRLDYQTGNFSQWTERHLHRTAQVTIVSRPARTGYRRTARFVVAPGDYTNGGTSAERSEVMASIAKTGNPREGKTQWFAWSSFFPTGTHVSPGGWLIFTQWHQSGSSGMPNIALGLSKTTPVRVLVSARGKSPRSPTSTEKLLGTLPTNKWVDFKVYIKWSANPRVGRVIVRMNGRVVANTAAATLYSGMSAYLKQGIYRASSRQRQTIYHTGTRRGPTLASVAR
jgi:hypothetical protein